MSKKTTRFLIREAQLDDLSVCCQLDHSIETPAVWQMKLQRHDGSQQIAFDTLRLPRAIRVEYPRTEAQLRQQLRDAEGMLVAEGQEMLLGYVQMSITPSAGAWISNLVVHAPLRRRRIGTALLHQAQTWARLRELPFMTVETTTRSMPAIQFLQGQGFLFCGFNEHYYANQEIAVFFGKKL